MKRFTVVLTPEPGDSAYNVSVPALPGCFTWGATVEEALEQARDAIAVFLAGEEESALFADVNGDAIIATVAVEVAADGVAA
jgi:predicted RNase H-like HicB family nuclease